MNVTFSDRMAQKARSFGQMVRPGDAASVRFRKDGTFFPFVELSPRAHLADDHKWSFPFIATAAHKGWIRPGAVMTLWEKHAREDFHRIRCLPPKIGPGEDPAAFFHYAARHLSRTSYNTALIASGLISEIIVVYPGKWALMDGSIRDWEPVITMTYSLHRMKLGNIFGETVTVYSLSDRIPSDLNLKVHFCLQQNYQETLTAVMANDPARSLVNNFDLDLYNDKESDIELNEHLLRQFPRVYLAAQEVKPADYTVICTSTEIFFDMCYPDNFPGIAKKTLKVIAPLVAG